MKNVTNAELRWLLEKHARIDRAPYVRCLKKNPHALEKRIVESVGVKNLLARAARDLCRAFRENRFQIFAKRAPQKNAAFFTK